MADKPPKKPLTAAQQKLAESQKAAAAALKERGMKIGTNATAGNVSRLAKVMRESGNVESLIADIKAAGTVAERTAKKAAEGAAAAAAVGDVATAVANAAAAAGAAASLNVYRKAAGAKWENAYRASKNNLTRRLGKKPTAAQLMSYASLVHKGKNTKEFLNTVASAPAKAVVAEAAVAEAKKVVADSGAAGTAKLSEAKAAWTRNFRAAQADLKAELGKNPTSQNASRFAMMRRKNSKLTAKNYYAGHKVVRAKTEKANKNKAPRTTRRKNYGKMGVYKKQKAYGATNVGAWPPAKGERGPFAGIAREFGGNNSPMPSFPSVQFDEPNVSALRIRAPKANASPFNEV